MLEFGNNKFAFPDKPGGGGFLQPYNPKNGEYVNMTDAEIFDHEMWRVKKLVYQKIHLPDYQPHFPTLGFHNDKYNELWVQGYRNKFEPKIYELDKATYLLTYNSENDKSKQLIEWGYSRNDPQDLLNDIVKNSDFTKSKYNRIDKYGMRIYVPTTLKNNKKVISIWIFDNKKNRKLKFVTLNLKRSKYEKLFEIRG